MLSLYGLPLMLLSLPSFTNYWLLDELEAETAEALNAANFGPRQFTNHQISFAHAKIERSQLVLAGVSLYIGFVYINFYISSGRMPWLSDFLTLSKITQL